MGTVYKIETNDLSVTYGIKIIKCRGIWELPKRKGETEHSWPDSDGVDAFTDAADIFFEPKIIILYCYINNAVSAADFITKLNAFVTLITAAGEKTLEVPNITATFETFCKDGIQWTRYPDLTRLPVYGEFILKLVEPDPTILPV